LLNLTVSDDKTRNLVDVWGIILYVQKKDPDVSQLHVTTASTAAISPWHAVRPAPSWLPSSQ
jgi:hypothetical protein